MFTSRALRAALPAAILTYTHAHRLTATSQPRPHQPAARATPPRAAAAEWVPSVLFVECGMGADQHGQNPTKACVRACRNAIEFNSLPAMRQLIPGGYEGMRLHVQLGVPSAYREGIDLEQVAAVFPYGRLKIEIEPGGLLADSGVALEAMGDKNSDMIIAVACVTVGYAAGDDDGASKT